MSTIKMYPEDVVTLQANKLNSDGTRSPFSTNPTWASSDPTVAEIFETASNGAFTKLKALAVGNTNITVDTATITVSVVAEPIVTDVTDIDIAIPVPLRT